MFTGFDERKGLGHAHDVGIVSNTEPELAMGRPNQLIAGRTPRSNAFDDLSAPSALGTSHIFWELLYSPEREIAEVADGQQRLLLHL